MASAAPPPTSTRAAATDDGGDAVVLELLRERGHACVADLTAALGVTATAVRHRLVRLLDKGWIERKSVKAGRGRPGHRYRLTRAGLLHCGHNLADLAAVLWRELLAIPDAAIRRDVMARVAKGLAAGYGGAAEGPTFENRMATVADLFRHRRLPMEVGRSESDLPVLQAHACPYPGLAEEDASVCEMEAMMLSELVGESLVLSECQATGGKCCTFGRPATAAPTTGATDPPRDPNSSARAVSTDRVTGPGIQETAPTDPVSIPQSPSVTPTRGTPDRPASRQPTTT